MTMGSAGGTVVAEGVQLVIPAGAIQTNITVRVAMDSTGAPATPAGLVAVGNVYVITPHGGEFAQPVEVRIPVSATTLQPNQALKLAKAQPGGEWLVLEDSAWQDGALSARVSSFSYFMPVIVTYPLTLVEVEPLRVTATSLSCGDQNCGAVIGPVTATYSVTTNNGQLPANCSNGALQIQDGAESSFSASSTNRSQIIAFAGGSLTRTIDPTLHHYYYFVVGLRCTGFSVGLAYRKAVNWQTQPTYPAMAVLRAPAQLDVVAGLGANLDAVLAGGAARIDGNAYISPTEVDRAVIDWQRSDDNGTSWRPIARSYQNEANPNPLGDGYAWRYWSVRHGFVASVADQGALIRLHACYTPPDVAAPPCVTGPATRLNVLQQSALPVVIDAPRSVLVKTGQTASFSATAGGAPAPTLQWQTRAANSTGAWTDVSSSTGATTGNYTTPVLSTADNGTQYRVAARNALGSAESAAVTVSVSDLDVVPTIGTQPASLSVSTGNDAAFAIAAHGTEALSYQWRKDGVAITGANSPVLRLPAVTAGQAGAYSVVVSNAAGSVASNPATLTVSAGAPAAVAPTIVTQPVPVLVNAGNTATFAVGASGSAPLAFQWQRNGVDIPGATAVFYSIASAAAGDAGSYSVRVSNGAGTAASSGAALTVIAAAQNVAPTITTQPSAQAQVPGGSATFAVAVTGSGPIGYQWRKGGATIAGATSAVLTLPSVAGTDAGSYSVVVSNTLGSATSDAALLTVIGAPTLGNQPASASVAEGSSATFQVTASGSGLLYQWTRNNVAIAGAASASYTTPVLALADSGAVYGVVVYNGAGLVFSQGAVLTVAPAPTLVGIVRASATGDGSTALLGQTPSLSADGQRVAFVVPYQYHAYVRDLRAQTLTQVNLKPDGTPSSNGVGSLKLAAGGRYAVFTSTGNDLVAGDTNITGDVFVRDLQAGTTTRVNVSTAGQDTVSDGADFGRPDISADGRWILMFSYARLDDDGRLDRSNCLYLHDRASGQTVQIPNAGCVPGRISANGRFVLFYSATGSESSYTEHLQLYDHHPTDPTQRVTTTLASYLGNTFNRLAISDDGMVIAFDALPSRVEAGATSIDSQIYLIDRALSAMPVPVGAGVGGRSDDASLSGNGRYVAFHNLGTTSTLVVHDRVTGTTRRLQKPSGCCASGSEVVLSGDGAVLGFTSYDPELASRPSVGSEVFVAPRP